MDFAKSKYAFTVKSTTARAPKTTEPELTVVAGLKGRFKTNEAASKLMSLKPGDSLVFINTEDSIRAMKEDYAAGVEEAVAIVNEAGGLDQLKVDWYICKGWEMYDANGIQQTQKKPLTKAEEEKLIADGVVDEDGKAIAPNIPAEKGSRLSTKQSEVRTGMILEGTDSNNCPELRADVDEDKHAVYSVSNEPITAEFDRGDGTFVPVDVYQITFSREEDKIERKKSEE